MKNIVFLFIVLLAFVVNSYCQNCVKSKPPREVKREVIGKDSLEGYICVYREVNNRLFPNKNRIYFCMLKDRPDFFKDSTLIIDSIPFEDFKSYDYCKYHYESVTNKEKKLFRKQLENLYVQDFHYPDCIYYGHQDFTTNSVWNEEIEKYTFLYSLQFLKETQNVSKATHFFVRLINKDYSKDKKGIYYYYLKAKIKYYVVKYENQEEKTFDQFGCVVDDSSYKDIYKEKVLSFSKEKEQMFWLYDVEVLEFVPPLKTGGY